MPEITAAMVKELRDRTQAAMMLCKEALTESGGDMDKAIAYIKIKMVGKSTDRGVRVAAEGVVAVAVVDDQDGAIVELNSETDFVARNADFKELAKELAVQVARTKGHSVETVLSQELHVQPGAMVKDRINDVFTRLREKIEFKRFAFISTDEKGTLAAYVHMPANDKIGVLVELEAESPQAAKGEAAKSLGKELAMQIAASRPRFLNRNEVPAAVVASEREIARATALNEGRPEAALDKIVEGRVRKFYEEAVLLDQPYLRDPKKSVSQVIKEAGGGLALRRYVRFEVGEHVTGVAASGAIKETVE